MNPTSRQTAASNTLAASTFGKAARRVAGTALALVAACGAASAQSQIDPSQAGPAFKGWGTSLAWWANITGRWNDEAQFESLMDDVFSVDEGLGLTIVRLNIGAGQRPDLRTGYMLPGRLMPAYKDGPDAPYVYLADRAQTRVLLEGIERGVQFVEANGNSPPWWMTITQDSSGNSNGPNLAPSMYDDYAEYLATVAKWYQDEHGVSFSSITPLNEPAATWWDGNGNQEGCNIPQSEHPALLAELRSALDAQGLTGTPISGPEEWSTQWTLTGLNSYPSETLDSMSHIATHSYNVDNRAGLNAYAETYGKSLWMSEYGTGAATEYDSAMQLARRIIGDFREMPALEAWVIWQVMSTSHFQHTWSCMLADFATVTPSYTFRPQYFSFANFSRFIRPGSRFMPTGDDDAIAAFQPALGRLVIVAVNSGTSPRLSDFNLGSFDGVPGAAEVHRTSRTEDLVQRPNQVISGDRIQTILPPESVTTFVIEGVSTPELPATDWNADGWLSQADVAAFIRDQEANADQTDLDRDGAITFLDTIEFLRKHAEAGPDFDVTAISFDSLQDGGLSEVNFGNSPDGGSYLADNRAFVQAFAANGEEGGMAIPLTGSTIEAGETYVVRVRAADFNQPWTTGGPYLIGLDASVPSSSSTPGIAARQFSPPRSNGPQPMRFVTNEFTFTASSTVSDPYLVVRTAGVSQGNQRVGFESVTITRVSTP
ncbi:MAG: glycoside hydrolase [Planctomycetota bacterium]